ncbi:MAG TPA: helix-hairpin-helix domain-containing protein [Candidatus Paceibacterota bacterium]|nr:helix-hairpin-helix domain-containing protein [Candidatus Paceibacterota bacterium]
MRNYLRTLPFLIFAFPLAAFAALVNINTADDATLETLPGIGPTKAAAIIGYRDANGPFARIEDIQDVSGIGPATYANIEPLITVADTATAPAASTTPAEPLVAGVATYAPPPATLTIDAGSDRRVTLEVPARFSARVTTRSGAADPAARITWSFGDGSSGEGTAVEKLYRYAGTYVVTAIASDGPVAARGEFVVTAAPAAPRIANVSSDGITLANDASEELDLSGWRLSTGVSAFRIPVGMTILPGTSVLVPFTVANLPVATQATLAYPDGITAAQYPPLAVQLPAAATGSNVVQRVEPAVTTALSDSTHEEVTAVGAPAAATELAAAGAAFAPPAPAVSSVPAVTVRPAAPSGLGALVRSPWTYGLLGVITVAGGAFFLL